MEEEKPTQPARGKGKAKEVAQGKGKGRRAAAEAAAKVGKAKAKAKARPPSRRSKWAVVRSGGNPEAGNRPNASVGGLIPPAAAPLPPPLSVAVPPMPLAPPVQQAQLQHLPGHPGVPVDLHAKVDYAVSNPFVSLDRGSTNPIDPPSL
jgi:hypothetical protein